MEIEIASLYLYMVTKQSYSTAVTSNRIVLPSPPYVYLAVVEYIPVYITAIESHRDGVERSSPSRTPPSVTRS